MQKSKSLLTKVITICLSVICCVALALFAVSCGDNTEYKVEDGHLYLIVKGEKTDLGQVVGPKGDKGDQGEKGEQGEQGVPGNNGENGKDGNGIEGVEVNEEGKLVITYTNGETAVIEIPGKVCEHEFKEFELREANCQHDGLILKVCNDCGWAELEEVEGGHDFSLAPVEIDSEDLPENVVNLDYEADPENEDDREHNVINGTFTATIRCLHCEEEAEVEFKFADIEIRVVEPTHIKEGLITELINYAIDEVEYNDQVVTMTTLDKIGEHIYNGNEIDADRIYAPAELQEIFGDNYGKFVNYNEFECGEEGYAWFKCDECEKFVLLTVVEKHEFGEPNIQFVYEDCEVVGVKVSVECANCHTVYEPLVESNRVDIEADCATEEHRYVEYSYVIYGEEFDGTKDIFKGVKNNSVHRHGDATLNIDVAHHKAYLEEIFADGGLTILANEMNCYDPEDERSVLGNAVFTCDLCKKNLNVNVIDDHNFVLDNEHTIINAEQVHIAFKCSVCGAEDAIDVEDYEIEVINANCQHGGSRTLYYTLNGEEKSKVLSTEPLAANKHEIVVGEENVNLNLNHVYSITELKQLVGEDLEAAGITLLANEMNCLTAGNATFTCALCNKAYAINVRGDHDLELAEANELAYNPLTGEVSGSLKLTCKVCHEDFELEYEVGRDEKANNCTEAGYKVVTYTYNFDGIHTEELWREDYPIDANWHVYGEGEEAVGFDLNGHYTISLLKEIFGDDFIELANDRDCTNPGDAVVTCTLCGKSYRVAVYGDHVYEGGVDFITTGDEEEDDEVEVNWYFECAECHAIVEGSDVVLAKVIPATNKAEGKVYVEIVIELNGVEKTFSKTIRVLPVEPTLHHQGEFNFYEDEPVNTNELDELGVEYRTFANDPYHVAIACDDEDCGEILVWANVD